MKIIKKNKNKLSSSENSIECNEQEKQNSSFNIKEDKEDKEDKDKKTKNFLKFGKYQKKDKVDKKLNLPILNNTDNIKEDDCNVSNLEVDVASNEQVETLSGFSEDDEVKKIRDLSIKTLEKTLNAKKDKTFLLGGKKKVLQIDNNENVLEPENLVKKDSLKQDRLEEKQELEIKKEEDNGDAEKTFFASSDLTTFENFAETFHSSPIDISANFHESINLKIKSEKINNGDNVKELLKNITKEQKMAIIKEYENEEAKILDAFELANHENNDEFYAQKRSEEEYEKWMIKNNQPE